MAVTKQKKNEIFSHLIAEIKEAKSIGFAQTSGMSVSDFADLRADLRSVQTSYTLAKKTLIKIAIKEALGIDIDLETLPGQVGMICSKEDAIAGLSKTNAFIGKVYNKKAQVQKIVWVASIFEWEVKTLEETKVIASMPSREVLLGRLVGSMMAPVSALARFFDAGAKELEKQGKETLSQIQKAEKSE